MQLDSAMKDQHLTIHWPLIGMSLDDARRYGCCCPRREDVMKAETRIYVHRRPPAHLPHPAVCHYHDFVPPLEI